MRATATALLLALALQASAADRPVPRPPATGPVCDDSAIVGIALAPIAEPDDCNVARPVELASVAGVALDPPTLIGCGAARALRTWVERAARVGFPEGRLQALQIAGGYACRPRNNVKGAKISEHAKGRAIDIAGFRLDGGQQISIARDWDGIPYGTTLHRLYAAGCGTFTTTLGPGADDFHQTHLHFDIEARKGSPFCQ